MRATTLASLSLAALLAACASSAASNEAPAAAPKPTPAPASLSGGGLPAEPPAPLPLEPTRFPPFQELTLASGARVIVVENHEQPYVSVNLRIENGDAADPASEAGLAQMTADLLDKGTKTRDAREIAQAVDFDGSTLSAASSPDWTSITLGTLTDHLDSGLDLLADVVMNPTFPQDELETERKRTLSTLQVAQSQPAFLAQRRFMREVYGAHPYGVSATPTTVKAIDRDAVLAFHDRYYTPSNALFVVAGDVHADDVVARLNRRFGGWAKGTAPTVAMPAPPAQSVRRLVFVDKPGSVQAVMRVGHLLPPASSRDWIGLDVMNQVLGGGVSGWLFQQLREEKGYTYGAYSSATENQGPGYFLATAEVRNEVADSALAGLLALLEQMRSEAVPQPDLDAAKAFMTGSFPLRIETPTQVAGQVATTILLGRPADYLQTYRQRVAATTAADVQRSARQYLHPDRSVIVVVGDASKILDSLTPLADSVELYDISGKPLSRAELSAAAQPTPLDVDASAFAPRTTTYQILFQGNPVGESSTVVTREQRGGRAVVHATTTLKAGPGQTQEVVFDPVGFVPISATATGPASMQLDVANGRITGTITAMGKVDTVDVAYQPGTLLPGMDPFAVAGADLASDGKVRFQLLSPRTGGTALTTATVAGDTTLSVPAGTFDVYRLDLSGPQPATLFVRKKAPHLVIRQELAAPPIVLELKSLTEGGP